jgi:transcriptional regulator with XRE-family HTH domain
MIRSVRKPDGAVQLNVEKLYEAITRERRERGMTLADLAAVLNVNMSTIACWRHGGGINGDVLVRLCLWMPHLDLRAYARPPADPLPAATKVA